MAITRQTRDFHSLSMMSPRRDTFTLVVGFPVMNDCLDHHRLSGILAHKLVVDFGSMSDRSFHGGAPFSPAPCPSTTRCIGSSGRYKTISGRQTSATTKYRGGTSRTWVLMTKSMNDKLKKMVDPWRYWGEAETSASMQLEMSQRFRINHSDVLAPAVCVCFVEHQRYSEGV